MYGMKKRKLKPEGASILNKILLPMVIVSIVQSVLFIGFFTFGGISHTLDVNAYEVFSQRVSSRNRELAVKVDNWTDINLAVNNISKKFQDFIAAESITEQQFNADSELKKAFLSSISRELISVLRQNKVNGVFLILTDGVNSEGGTKYGIDIMDYDQDANEPDGKDLLIERGPVTVSKEMGYSFSSWWEALYDFDKIGDGRFYSKPLSAAYENPDVSFESLGYWGAPHRLSKDSSDLISYSVPVRSQSGDPIAVFGVEVTLSYLKSLLPGSELDSGGAGSYTLAVLQEDCSYLPVIYDESSYLRIFGKHKGSLKLKKEEEKLSIFNISGENGKVVSCVKPVNGGSDILPYDPYEPVLIGSVKADSLLTFSNDVKLSIFLIVGITFLMSITCVYILSRRFSRPIKLLAERVRRIRPSNNVNLGRVNIKEIDRLIVSIEQLNKNAKEYGNRISEIIKMSGMPIGTFEIHKQTGNIFFSDEFREVAEKCLFSAGIIDFSKREENDKKLSKFIDSVNMDIGTVIYHFPNVGGSEKWLSVRISEGTEKTFGIVVDITAERLEKRKIEYERDHDMLTDLLNRRALHKDLNVLFSHPGSLGTAAMIMMDVDNLKYVNDNYGHDYGDAYLKGVAAVLKRHATESTRISRISGDEFIFFVYNTSREETLEIIEGIKQELKVSYIDLPDNQTYRIRLSGGIAWYPEDSDDVYQLIKYADFAMFQIKKSIKGEFYQFDRKSYEKNSYLIELGDEINRLIENGQIEYYLQPVIDIEEEKIHAYESLMRPQSSAVKTPLELLTLARSQGRLYQVELLTWKESLDKFRLYKDSAMKGRKLFINTISSQPLNGFDYDDIYRKYKDLLPDTVIEITEEDKSDNIKTSPLLKRIHMWGSEVAIDDFGSGYNGQALLLDIKADYVKIDMNMIRNIECDPDRQSVVRSLVEYSSQRNIKIIAEGVETVDELSFLVSEGIRYIQGFLLGRPAPEPGELTQQQLEIIAKCKSERGKKRR